MKKVTDSAGHTSTYPTESGPSSLKKRQNFILIAGSHNIKQGQTVHKQRSKAERQKYNGSKRDREQINKKKNCQYIKNTFHRFFSILHLCVRGQKLTVTNTVVDSNICSIWKQAFLYYKMNWVRYQKAYYITDIKFDVYSCTI